jgi:hypothetical protein
MGLLGCMEKTFQSLPENLHAGILALLAKDPEKQVIWKDLTARSGKDVQDEFEKRDLFLRK